MPLGHEAVEVGDEGELFDQGAELLVRASPFLVGPLPLGDVHPEALDVRSALRIVHDRPLVVHPHDPPVLGDHAVLDRERLPRVAEPLARLGHPLEVVRMEGLLHDRRVVLPLLRGVAEKRLHLRARVEVRARKLHRPDVHPDRRFLDDPPEALLGALELELGALLAGDVEDRALEDGTIAVRRTDQLARLPDPNRAAVARDEPVLERERLPRLAPARMSREHALAVVRMEDPREEAVILLPVLHRVAHRLHDARAGIEVRGRSIQTVNEDHDGKLLRDRPEAILALPRLLRRAVEIGGRPERHRDHADDRDAEHQEHVVVNTRMRRDRIADRCRGEQHRDDRRREPPPQEPSGRVHACRIFSRPGDKRKG